MRTAQQSSKKHGFTLIEIMVVVSIVGLVTTPGVVTLAPGARVADALRPS